MHAAAGGGMVQTISDDGCLADLAEGPTGEAVILVAQLDGALVDAFDPPTQRLVAVWVDEQGTLKSSIRAAVIP